MAEQSVQTSESTNQNINPFSNMHQDSPENQTQETTNNVETTAGEGQETAEITLGEKNYSLDEKGIEAMKADYEGGKVPITIGEETFEFDLNNQDDLDAFKKYVNGEEVNFESEEAGEEAKPNVLTLKVEENEETFDITKEEDKQKVIEYAQKGRYLEREMQSVNEVKRGITEERNVMEVMKQSLDFNYLRNQGASLAVEPMFVELNDQNGEVKYDKDGNPVSVLYNNIDDYHKAKADYQKNNKLVAEYRNAYQSSVQKYREQLKNFSTKHNIADVDKFLNESVNPYIAPFTTAGALPLPDDFFEMIHYWKNKTVNEQKIREDERKKRATAPTIKKVTVGKVNHTSNGNDFMGNIPGHKKVELIKQN